MDATSLPRPTGATARRHSGRKLAVAMVFMLPLAASSAVFLWYIGKDPSGPILTVTGVDDEHAVLLRRGYEERGYVHLVVADRDGAARWSEPLFGVQDPPSVAASHGQVYVRVTEARGNASLHAFDMLTGEFLWATQPPEPEPRPSFGAPALFATEAAIWELDGGSPPTVTVTAADGSHVARVELPAGDAPRDAFLDEGVLWVHAGLDWMNVSASGELSPAASAPAAPERVGEPGETCPPSRVGRTVWACAGRDLIAR